MRILYFNCFAGISGDMAMGALLDLGIDREAFLAELDKLNADGYEIIISEVIKYGIKGTDASVVLKGEPQSAGYHNHRSLADIEGIIDGSGLSESVKAFSKKVYREIARAEAKIHGSDEYEVKLHEVGELDSIIDVVGTAICLEMLRIEKVFSSVLHDGCGHIECSHGILPVPVPAVLQMLAGSGIPLVSENVRTELITPTGMALIKCMASGFGKAPPMIVEKVGYGFGKRDTGRLAALRVTMGETFTETDINHDGKYSLETGFTMNIGSDIICNKFYDRSTENG